MGYPHDRDIALDTGLIIAVARNVTKQRCAVEATGLFARRASKELEPLNWTAVRKHDEGEDVG